MNTLKPCSYCGNTTFNLLPNMALGAGYVTSMLGMRARQDIPSPFWEFTLVACTQCGNSLLFTTNAPPLAQRIPGSKIVQVGGE
jgi:hypothetical protein